MAEDEQVCGCMGVTKGDIVNAVADGCDTFEALQETRGCEQVVVVVLQWLNKYLALFLALKY